MRCRRRHSKIEKIRLEIRENADLKHYERKNDDYGAVAVALSSSILRVVLVVARPMHPHTDILRNVTPICRFDLFFELLRHIYPHTIVLQIELVLDCLDHCCCDYEDVAVAAAVSMAMIAIPNRSRRHYRRLVEFCYLASANHYCFVLFVVVEIVAVPETKEPSEIVLMQWEVSNCY